jgi:hypothetical protein
LEDPNLNRADDSTLAKRANMFLLAAVLIFIVGAVPILFNIYLECTLKTGVGHIESSVYEYIPGTGRGSLGQDVYHLQVKYVQPPLNRVVSVTADSSAMPTDKSKMVTFLYDPNDPVDITLSGFFTLFGRHFIVFVYAFGAFGAWWTIKPRKKKAAKTT